MKKQTKRQQVTTMVLAGLTREEIKQKVKGLTPGTLNNYYYTAKKGIKEVTQRTVAKLQENAPTPILPNVRPPLTKDYLIGKILDSDLVPHQKKTFVMFAVNEL